ncbi:hypothetical protein RRG08_015653 [Elysia crispata]|uniref:Uncharacterized protein n=1 Tax=Elysia crispata TaxID=231223 RepID=A0AAE0XSD3_9GAST|nr:hypothetical protein RRG08_015653 [Elysia crispata]
MLEAANPDQKANPRNPTNQEAANLSKGSGLSSKENSRRRGQKQKSAVNGARRRSRRRSQESEMSDSGPNLDPSTHWGAHNSGCSTTAFKPPASPIFRTNNNNNSMHNAQQQQLSAPEASPRPPHSSS